jgi:hypothetical protein
MPVTARCSFPETNLPLSKPGPDGDSRDSREPDALLEMPIKKSLLG